MAGPLQGIRIVEMASIGPCPFAGMVLADMGATLIRIDRVPRPRRHIDDFTSNDTLVDRGRLSVALDLKNPQGRELALEILDGADAVIEGFRPGVMERLGLGPEQCRARNPKLVYGRVTGWGQHGPLANTAGHDLNYVALTGALHAMGDADRPPAPPLNLVGDYGAGGMYLAVGVLGALLEAMRTGEGQVVDAAMVDGAASMMSMMYSLRSKGMWNDGRQSNVIDGAAHFYGVYECADGRFLAVGAIEPQFYSEMRRVFGLVGDEWDAQWDTASWPRLRVQLASIVRSRTRDDWCGRSAGTDACISPVLKMGEAPHHPQLKARGTFHREGGGGFRPAAAPRFERPAAPVEPAPSVGAHTMQVLLAMGRDAQALSQLAAGGVIHDGVADRPTTHRSAM